MKNRIIKSAAILILSGLSLPGALSFAAEFEVLDKFSVDGYSVLRGSADIPGGSFTVGGSTFVVKNGNVGVGTANPGFKTVVYQAPADGVNIYGTNARFHMAIGVPGTRALYIGQDTVENLVVFGHQDGSGGFSWFSHNGSAWGERMRIHTNGNIGIGTTSPATALSVNGTISYPDLASGSADRIQLQTGYLIGLNKDTGYINIHSPYNVRIASDYTQANKVYLDVTGSYAYVMGGNVGIGTTAPGYKLDVNGTGNFSALTTNNYTGPAVSAGACTLSPGSWVKVGSWYTVGQGARLLIQFVGAQGFNGVPTTTGRTILDLNTGNNNSFNISGYYYAEGGNPVITNVKAVATAGTTGNDWDIYAYYPGCEGNTFLIINNDPRSSFAVLNTVAADPGTGAEVYVADNRFSIMSGNVGIGVQSPAVKLEVNGRIKDQTGFIMPVGSIITYGGSAAPAGWLLCDGSAVSRATYADLYTAIGTTFGTGDGSSTFNTPDLRGIFVRGAGTSGKLSNANGGAFTGTLGTYQNDKFQGHWHNIRNPGTNGLGSPVGGPDDWMYSFGDNTIAASEFSATTAKTDTANGAPRTGTETNPANLGLNYIIKY